VIQQVSVNHKSNLPSGFFMSHVPAELPSSLAPAWVKDQLTAEASLAHMPRCDEPQ
jgi:hypothetical protein